MHEAARTDPDWVARLLGWLRGPEANMRTASLVGAAEYVKARLDAVPAELANTNGRQVVDSVLQRADEPGELLAYWTSRYGRAIPKPIKRGVADAVKRLYNEYALLKYDTASHAFRFGDVLELTHASPDPGKAWQSELFKHALDRRHNRDNGIPEHLHMLVSNAWLRANGSTGDWLSEQRLKMAGMTWEDALSAVGSKVDKAKLWEALIPSMGYMALLRNLRNFDEAGVRDETAAWVGAKLSTPEEVARSRQFPFRFLSAYRAAPSLRWGYVLDTALTLSLSNVPALDGRTLVLVDRSGSMDWTQSEKTKLSFADTAAVFGSAIALRNPGQVDLVQFGSGSAPVPYGRGDALLKVVERFHGMGGTQTLAAVQAHYRGQHRVVIVTDEQAWAGYGDPGSAVPPHVPVYTWNLAGYRHGHGASGPNRHYFGGMTDTAFKMIPLLEAGKNADWPF